MLAKTDEQIAIQDALNRVMGGRGAGLSPAVWEDLREQGWLGLGIPESCGGFGGTAIEVGILMRTLGYHGVASAFLPSLVMGAGLLQMLPRTSYVSELLGRAASGETRLALCQTQGDGEPATVALRFGDGWRLTGSKMNCLGADQANLLIVAAELQADEKAIFAVEKDLSGLSLTHFDSLYGIASSDVRFEVQLPGQALLGIGEQARTALQQTDERAMLALACEATGAMAALCEQTADYVQLRKQFGKSLSEFQVVRHRVAEMRVAALEAEAAAYLACLLIPARRPVLAAKAKVDRASQFIAHAAIQLHGAIGTTEELAVGGFVRRLLSFKYALAEAEDVFGLYDEEVGDREYRESLLRRPSDVSGLANVSL
jgi:alkylation response protein AidB-like acyl-CoA dehydrogenase